MIKWSVCLAGSPSGAHAYFLRCMVALPLRRIERFPGCPHGQATIHLRIMPRPQHRGKKTPHFHGWRPNGHAHHHRNALRGSRRCRRVERMAGATYDCRARPAGSHRRLHGNYIITVSLPHDHRPGGDLQLAWGRGARLHGGGKGSRGNSIWSTRNMCE